MATAAAIGRDWYSIREAAEYLSVSEPTIFRWMKDRSLSFYKVGGSTRFTQESLDGIIRKRTGKREAEAAARRCASCGHSELLEGNLQGTGQLYFKPAKVKFWTWRESTVPIRAHTCVSCGYIQMHANTDKLVRLKSKGGSDA